MRTERNNYQIGIYLEKALSEKNMSVKQLSDGTGISARLLSRYLINEKMPISYKYSKDRKCFR